MIKIIVLCLFYASCTHIWAIPSPQFMYPPSIFCDPYGVPCVSNDAIYSTGAVYPFNYPTYPTYNVEPVQKLPNAHGSTSKNVHANLSNKRVENPTKTNKTKGQKPNDTKKKPQKPGNSRPKSNGLNNPMENLVRATLSQIVQMSKNESDFKQNTKYFSTLLTNKKPNNQFN